MAKKSNIKDKNPTGRPRKFKSPAEMQMAIEEYFAECNNRECEVYVKSKQEIVKIKNPIPYTIEGLCVALDIDRSTLLTYEKDENRAEFHNTISRAKMIIQKNTVERALGGENNSHVSIFIMKNNFGYEDRSEIAFEEYEIEL